MEVHVSERRYKCGECGKLYKTVGHVREHMRAHSDERPYHCPRCNKGYKTKVIWLYLEIVCWFELSACIWLLKLSLPGHQSYKSLFIDASSIPVSCSECFAGASADSW